MNLYKIFFFLCLFVGAQILQPAYAMDLQISSDGCFLDGEEETVKSIIKRLKDNNVQKLTLVEDKEQPNIEEVNRVLNKLPEVETLRTLYVVGKLNQESIDYIGDITQITTLIFNDSANHSSISADTFSNWSSLSNLHTLDLSETDFADDDRRWQEAHPHDIKFLEFLQSIEHLPCLKNINMESNHTLFPTVLRANNFGHPNAHESKRQLGVYMTWRKTQIRPAAKVEI